MTPLLMLASLLGVVTFFLPFASHVSPAEVIRSDLWRLAPPLVIPLVLVPLRMLQIRRGTLPRAARRVAWVVAVASLAISLTLFVPIGEGTGMPGTAEEWFTALIPLIVLVLAVLARKRQSRTPEREAMLPFVALRTAYLAGAVVLLISLRNSRPEIGYWFTLVTSVSYAIDVARGGAAAA